MTRWNPEHVVGRVARLRFEEPEPLPRRAAVAIVMHFGEDTEVLLMKRARRRGDPWSGQISLPGGRHEPEDPDLFTTAIRETREEVGIDLGELALPVGRLEPLTARARGRILPLDISPYVFRVDERPIAVPGEEAEEAFWFPVERAAAGVFDAPYSLVHEGNRLELPSWRFAEHTVWGMTHRILTRLIELARS